MERRCTASSPSVCEACPPGSFTALWNYIGRCLRCSVCARNMVQSRECRRDADCSCECRHGYWYKERAGMCVRWSECGTGHGVTAAGSPQTDIVCSPCVNGTFSDRVSSESGCSAHSVCVAPRSEVLRGTAWHDVICASPYSLLLITNPPALPPDAAHFLRPLLPSFFSHHALSVRRLRHLLGKLPSSDSDSVAKRRRSISRLTQDQLRARLDQWVREAGPAHLRSLPLLLAETGAMFTADRLTHKLGLQKVMEKQVNSASNQNICP
uniref:TNFR-Cys domain-containing protein n=1 Tax=Neogobius melanostomus TaxID=47308 RepID=A0A8C6TU63_9GOBI